ncbi:MAG TPA: HAMP domain-containing sensor histidine kinase [Chitinophagaceae bacterium]|jgi:signal transduction histidine kinase|nr:HAMP domain-containing sensor histidine kinase [Chitinophagaceae bacterium]
MKLLNYTTAYLAVLLLVLLSMWAGLFYYAMLDEIEDSIDDGLDNQKGLILQQVTRDTQLLQTPEFGARGYTIREIPAQGAAGFRDVYVDTMMFMQNEQDFEPVRLLRTVFRQHDRFYQLQVATSMVEEDDLVSELLHALVWLYAGLLASILLLNKFFLKRLWRPFYFLLEQLRRFRLEKGTISVAPARIEEFRLLNDTITHMVQQNVDSYNSQKHFIEHAAHELQTPVAISISKLESLAQRVQLEEEEWKLLASALDNLERLSRLNRSLLLLSKIENNQYLSQEPVAVQELVRKAAEDFEDQLAFSRLTVHLATEAPLSVNMNPELASVLVVNLFKNAVVHNRPGGAIWVTVTARSLQVSNTGAGRPLKEDQLFRRFSKERQAQGSTGLGLAIVKAIADLYRFPVTYAFSEGRHVFTLSFG